MPDIDYGPLQQLIGTWRGRSGLDIAPEPDGTERNPYFETIVFEAAGDVTNAESQDLAFIHYREVVQRSRTMKFFMTRPVTGFGTRTPGSSFTPS